MTGHAPTAKGRATRARIVAAASELVGQRSVAETSLDDVIERAGVSKSQLYHYFKDRAALLRAVVAYNTDQVLAAQAPHLDTLDTWKAIRAWFDALVELVVSLDARGGCPIGSLVAQLAETDEEARRALDGSFRRWEQSLADGLRSMQDRGALSRRADADRLATATIASMQGGLLLTQVRRDPRQLAIALDAAYAYLRAHASTTRRRPARRSGDDGSTRPMGSTQ